MKHFEENQGFQRARQVSYRCFSISLFRHNAKISYFSLTKDIPRDATESKPPDSKIDDRDGIILNIFQSCTQTYQIRDPKLCLKSQNDLHVFSLLIWFWEFIICSLCCMLLNTSYCQCLSLNSTKMMSLSIYSAWHCFLNYYFPRAKKIYSA